MPPIDTIHNAICSLDTYDAFVEQLRMIGAFHHHIAGFKPEYFWVSTWFNFFFLNKYKKQVNKSLGEFAKFNLGGYLQISPDSNAWNFLSKTTHLMLEEIAFSGS